MHQVVVPPIDELVELDLQVDVVLLVNVDYEVDARNYDEGQEHTEDYVQVDLEDLRRSVLEQKVLSETHACT